MGKEFYHDKDRAASCLYKFAEASGDSDANVSHDTILQHSDARS